LTKPSESKTKILSPTLAQYQVYWVNFPAQEVRTDIATTGVPLTLRSPSATRIGYELMASHPCMIWQKGIAGLKTMIVIPISSEKEKAKKASWVRIPSGTTNLPNSSFLLCEQIRAVDVRRLEFYMGTLERLQDIILAAEEILARLCPSISQRRI